MIGKAAFLYYKQTVLKMLLL